MQNKRTIVSRAVVSSIVAAVAVAAAPVVQEDGPAPTTVGEVSASVDGGSIAVSAPVDLGGQEPVVLAYDAVGDTPGGPETAAAGLDLTTMAAYVADGDEDVITFEWRVADLPDGTPPPEAVRYYWEFAVNNGTQYALQVKFSDLASSNTHEDPAGFATHVGNTFRLRGNCGSLTPVVVVGNCSHVAWLTGEYDHADDTIRVHVPLDIPAATALRPGVSIDPDPDGNQIWASFQAVLDNNFTRDSATQLYSYGVPTGNAVAVLREADGTAVRTASLDLTDGTATGAMVTDGLGAGEYTVDVTACFAGNCATSSAPVTL